MLLPDGTQVWLNADSRIAFDSDMQNKATREVKLTGEAFFDVKKDKKHPFIIHTDKIAIRVLGTAFNVKAYPKDTQTEATLLRGMIELTVNDRPEQKIILKPNEKFALTENSKPQDQNNIDATPATMVVEGVVPVIIGNKTYTEEVAWTQNQLVFHDETLAELKPRLERWFNVKINLDNTKTGNYRFTGSFKDETIMQALTALQSIKPFNYKINANDINIY
jgi:ferric-dicitrate binding protein FerR (iron transport regulator)